MAALTGDIALSPSGGELNPALTVDLAKYDTDYFPFHEFAVIILSDITFVRNEPVETLSRNLSLSGSASLATGYLQDFYNRIHIKPNPIDVGNLLSTQVKVVNVWNAFLDQSKLLSSIDQLNTSGIVLTEPVPAPTTFAPLEDRDYTLSISTEGSPIIDASYTFNFPTQQPVLKVIGKRVVVFPFRPNWKSNVNERYEWLTDVLIAYDSTEQRRSLRGSPRKSISYDMLLTGQARQIYENLIFDAHARIWGIPIWVDGEKLTAAAAALDTTVSLNTVDRGFLDAGLAILWASPVKFELVELVTVAASSVTVKDGLLAAWPEGTLMYPMRTSRIRTNHKFKNLTPALHTAQVAFEFIEPENYFTALDSAATYKTNPVYEQANNWGKDVTADYQRKLDVFDSQTGRLVLDDESERPDVFRVYNHFIHGFSERVAFVKWLYARRGRFNGIWFPSGQDDLTVLETIGSTATVIKVRYCNYALSILNKINRRDIRIKTFAGAVHYARIVTATDNGDDTEDLSIEAAIGATVEPEEISIVSFMAFSRLNADRVEVKYHTPEVAESTIIFKSLNDDV